MPDKSFDLGQDIFKETHPSIHVVTVHENAITQQILNCFSGDSVIGLAPVYGAKCALVTIAISTLSHVLIVHFSSSKGNRLRLTPGRILLRDNIFCHPECQKYAFRMDRLSASLFLDQNLRITGGVDLLSLSNNNRRSLNAVMVALGGEVTLNKPAVVALFKHEEAISTPSRDVALQAWAACQAANLSSSILWKIPRIDTQHMEDKVYFLFVLVYC